jgi:50S ribosomal protein L16 3-hydroxylase
LADGLALARNPASRFSFIRNDAELLLFVDGECFECHGETAAFGERLCAEDVIHVAPELARSEAVQTLIVQLINQGSIAFEDGE